MIAKLIGQYLRTPTEKVIPLVDGTTITNPSVETLVELFDYKYVVESPKPSDAPEGFYYEKYYEEDDEHIYTRWELKESPTIEEPPLYTEEPQDSDFDRFNAILLGKEV